MEPAQESGVATEFPRKIRSFVLRQGRITSAQKRAFDLYWNRYGIEYQGRPRHFDASFHRKAPLVLEIGFGNGEELLHAALTEDRNNFLGIEVHRPGVGRAMNALAAADVGNVRLYHHDAVEVLEHEIMPAALTGVRVYFPDPWPKKRHHKRRLIQPDFVALLASRVAPGGTLHLATDWHEYAEHMRSTLDNSPAWRNPGGPRAFCEQSPRRIQTHFEQRGVRLGHPVWDLLYERR
ncbi:MAG: tRNA (guanosine(46)-N7)-methyltransferase TrmB [Rhodanobacteraceae bacterium]